MPASLQIGVFVLGAVLLLVGLLGGNFKLFGTEIASTIKNRGLRVVTFLFGLGFIGMAFQPSSLVPSTANLLTPTPPVIEAPTTVGRATTVANRPNPTQESPNQPTPPANPVDSQKSNIMQALSLAWDAAIRARRDLDVSALPGIFIGDELITEQSYVINLQQQALFETITPVGNLSYGTIQVSPDGRFARGEVILTYRAVQSSTITRQCVVQTSQVSLPMIVDLQLFQDGWKVGKITYEAPLPVGFPCQ